MRNILHRSLMGASPKDTYFTICVLEDNTTIEFTAENNNDSLLYYRVDNGNWKCDDTNPLWDLQFKSGQKIQFKMDDPVTLGVTTSSSVIYIYGIGTFYVDKPFNVEGNIMSLLYGDDFIDKTDFIGKENKEFSYAFYKLFINCENLINAKDLKLPATILSDGCYQYMFDGCTSLTSAPTINATTLADNCCSSMFSGCTSITSVDINVTSIGSSALYGCTSLTSVKIGEGVEKIGNDAFLNCEKLTSIEIPDSVTSIGDNAFGNCDSLTSISIGNSTAPINNKVFQNSPITYITVANTNSKYDSRNNCNAIIEKATNTLVLGCKNTLIPNSVTSIGAYAYYSCTGLTIILIPNSITSIGNQAFFYCNNLKTVYNYSNLKLEKGKTDPNNCYVAKYADKVINNPNIVVVGKFIFDTVDGNNILEAYLGGETDITLPANYNNETYAIGADVFNGNTSITSVTIPNSVTSIGERAFRNCTGLTSITIPGSVTSIGKQAFYRTYNQYNITSIEIGNGVESIGEQSFCYCGSPTEIIIPSSVTSIGSAAFLKCKIKTIYNYSDLVFQKGTTGHGCIAEEAVNVYNMHNGSIEGDFIFGKPDGVNTLLYYLGNATELVLPANYKGESYAIGANVFKGNTNITSVVIPNNVTSIGNHAFKDCTTITSVKFNAENCTTMGGYNNYVFDGCTALSTLTIGENVKKIPNYAFYNCDKITSITIPNSVTSIGNYAFYDCDGIKKVIIGRGVTSIAYYAFEDCSIKTVINYSTNITVGKNNGNGYVGENADVIVNNPDVVDGFLFETVNGKPTLKVYEGIATDITLPNNYKGGTYDIGDYAFKNNSSITSVNITDGVTSIGDQAFESCTALESVVIGDNVTSVGWYAFRDCTNLADVEIGNGVTTIMSEMFYGCSSLTSIVIPNSVTEIESNAFSYSGLNSITIPNSVTNIGTAFSYCRNLISITLPNTFTKIENGAFSGCTSLQSITIPNSVEIIGGNAFNGCSSLTSVTIPNSVTSIKWNAFEACSSLTSITIPSSVVEIDDEAFYNCSNLEHIYVKVQSPPELGTNVFYQIHEDFKIYVKSVSSYESNEWWKKYKGHFVADT